MPFSDRLQRIGKTGTWLAQKIDRSTASVSLYLRGINPIPAEIAERMEAALHEVEVEQASMLASARFGCRIAAALGQGGFEIHSISTKGS